MNTMAFSFGNAGNATVSGMSASVNVQTGSDLEDIQTQALGFVALSGESKVQLLPSAWPSDNLPPPTSSLISIASHKGLVAAGGPDAVVVAKTESVRKAFEGPSSGDGNIKPFRPELKIPMPMRISQLAFSADESYLVLSAEEGGGLAVYDVQSLLQGSTQPAFELSTNGKALRALVPNPTAEKGELFAIVTVDGNLMMANLRERTFNTGPNGQILKGGVSCVSWSAKGKQLVAGLGDGTANRITPEGLDKGHIPKPPSVNGDYHVSSISWLENNVFLFVHTPSNFDNSMAPSSAFHIVTSQPPSNFLFQKLSEPAGPFGLNRSPPHHFLLRLRDFPPNLQDLLIVASTASTDIGLFSRSKVPLTGEKPANKITGVFTMTEMSNDSARAILPLTGSLSETSPIGIALDLSSKEKVGRPIPGDEMNESLAPVPALIVLNNEGVLAAWWIIYAESVRQGTTYPGLIVAGTPPQASQPTSAPLQAPTSIFGATVKPTFGPSGAADNNGFGARPASSFVAPIGAFGNPSGLGKSQSPWANPSTSTSSAISGPVFGTPAFGSKSTVQSSAPAFGITSRPSLGTPVLPGVGRASPWGSSAPTAAFGQASGLGNTAPVFSSSPSGVTGPSSVGFASFASKPGFAAAAAKTGTTGSIFGTNPATSVFGTPSANSSTDTNNTFGGIASNIEENQPFGAKFAPSSTFKADTSTDKVGPTTSTEPKSPFFGGNFSSVLDEAAKQQPTELPVSKDADMDATEDVPHSNTSAIPHSTTPTSTPAISKAQPFTTTAPPLFGTSSPIPTLTGVGSAPPLSAGFGFGKPAAAAPKKESSSFGTSTNTNGKPAASVPTPLSKTPMSPKIRNESPQSRAEAPLPPDTTSKTTYGVGDSSVSSTETDAPLPPDFLPITTKISAPLDSQSSAKAPIPPELIPPNVVPGGPADEGDDSDFLSGEDRVEADDDDEGEENEDNENSGSQSDEEGSDENITKDMSPLSESAKTLGITPQSSFGGPKIQDAENSLFVNTQKSGQSNPQRSLFGEINRSAPILPPPILQTSPRSPSPIRSAIPPRILRPDISRSVSAPGVASQLLESQRLSSRPSQPSTTTLQQQNIEEQRRAEIKAKKEAEETQALVDNDDEMIQKYLASDIKATRTLDEFVAHSDYVGHVSADSIPAQVETVYRDINSMVDTLGINARALKCFIKGHTEQYKEEGRTREDLEDEEDWCLVEIEDFSVLVGKTLTRELENGRVKEVAEKLEACNDLQKDLIRLRAKHEDVKRIIATHSDPVLLAATRAQPLSAEQAAQQHDLRRDFTKFQNLLSEAEEGLTILKAKLVSQAGSNGKNTSTSVPTVDAVMRTITKMTKMAEEKSGDIDLLEGQMRRLRFSSAASVGSREGSPFTPQNNKSSLRNTTTSSVYSLLSTPDNTDDTSRRLQSSFMSSISARTPSSPPRKKMSGYTAEEKTQLKTKLARRKEVTGRLRAALQKAGTSIRPMDDDEM
ncbi:hypothetical protein B7494_g1890 [Chlorociboria aeruginascens]|nr:hypothetical protein B7494_g1890 [Chlorociboria aeruginascens]